MRAVENIELTPKPSRSVPLRGIAPAYSAAPAMALPLPPFESRPFIASANAARQPRHYFRVHTKFALALAVSIVWFAFSLWVATPWIRDLAAMSNWAVAIFAVGGIALVPGCMNAFLIASLAIDRRPLRKKLDEYPGVTILIAAYNEGKSIAATIDSIERLKYPGPFEVLVIDDGSSDATADIVETIHRGLAVARHSLIVTLDADSYLYADALEHLVERYAADPATTRAVAGAMMVHNSRTNWVTKMQEWDYFHGIAATKRVQSLYQGTLVAQGAFSIYDRQTLRDIGGWKNCVGEDIVLTWAILEAGWRVGHAEDAVCFTDAPESLRQLIRQRQRWARGMMEAFRHHPRILLAPRLSTAFIWWNLFFPWLDLAFTLCFMPGIVLAFFGIYWIVGPMTLALLPLSLLMNGVMYRVSARMFNAEGLRVRYNPWGFAMYALGYSLILQPACVIGYMSELLGMRKTWGTK
ncbi:MAG: glycosyltransferase [Usitatibacteraceae bacterium]